MDAPATANTTVRASGPGNPGRLSGGIAALRRPVAYPEHYCWFILAGALDVIFTWVVLHFGGIEVNPIANGAMEIGGVWGLIVLKFTMAAIVIAVCEVLSQRHLAHGRRLAVFSVAISFVPPTYAAAQIVGHAAAGLN